jgi:hypothetical protein
LTIEHFDGTNILSFHTITYMSTFVVVDATAVATAATATAAAAAAAGAASIVPIVE